MILFDIREDAGDEGYIADINAGLACDPEKLYLTRFGPVGSPHWRSCLDRGELSLEVLSGVVTHAGPRPDPWDESEDVVEFLCEGQAISYERVGPWALRKIRKGDRLSVTRSSAILRTPRGPVTYAIDVRIEWEPATNGRPSA